MAFTCVDVCAHFPNTEIPPGRAEWVRVWLSGDWSMQARHPECLSGTFYVARKGETERVSPWCGDEEMARAWLAQYRPNNSDEYEVRATTTE